MTEENDAYFNANQFFQQKVADMAKKKQDEIDEQEKQQNIMTGAAAAIFIVEFFCLPVVLMLLWNWLMPSIFGLATIGYFKALGLFIISKILFKHD